MRVNKRARVRLIGVTVIIVLSVAAILVGVAGDDGAFQKTVGDVVEDASLVGERIKVSGVVVPGSWNKKSNPMEFDIRDEGAPVGSPTIRVVYSGQVPSTFGDEVTAIVTGELGADGIVAATDLITKCPSKYSSGAEAITVATLLSDKASQEAKTIQVTGFVVPGSIGEPGANPRLKIQDKRDGGEAISVVYDGGLSEKIVDLTSVVITGHLEDDGTFTAANVALAGKKS